MEKICVDCMFIPYCYDSDFDRYADALNFDGTCDSFITDEEYNKRLPCKLGDYFMFNGDVYQVNCIHYEKRKGFDDFFVHFNNTDKDMEYILASQCTFLTKEEAEKKLGERNAQQKLS